jgi:hypothetical protein
LDQRNPGDFGLSGLKIRVPAAAGQERQSALD